MLAVNSLEHNNAENAQDVEAIESEPTEISSQGGVYEVPAGGEVTINVDYLSSNAGYDSSHGFYVADSEGNPIGGMIIEDDVKAFTEHEITINMDDYPGGEAIGFFIIPDGDDQNTELSGGEHVTFEQIDGVWTPMIDGNALSGAQGMPAYFSNTSLNADGYDHMHDNNHEGNQNWEDLKNGGDQDFEDINIEVSVTSTGNNDYLVGDDGDNVLNGGLGDDIIEGNGGDDTINGGLGDDIMFGGDGSDTLTFLAHQGNDVVDGGGGGAWTDTLQLEGFHGQGSEVGWTLTLNDGSSISSTDEINGEMILSGDAGGTITFDDGGSIDFENIEKIVW